MTEDRTTLETEDIVPVTSYEEELRAWRADERDEQGLSRQHPIDELLAEHHLMDAGLSAMERETRRLSVHHDLRPDAWEEIVDFAGNFIYQMHRRKEEQALFPVYRALVGEGIDAMVSRIADEHSHATRMTIDLANGVNEGDWEKVLRAAHLYLRVAREHLEREEHDVFHPIRAALTPEAEQELRERFAELERFGFGDRDRAYYIDLLERMGRRAGLTDILPE